MNRLDRHIEILLLNNDCVIVPGLGGFMAHYVPARYDANDFMFIPPTRTLGFNPQLTMNDSLLAQAYIESYDISYPEAIRRIEEEVNEVQQQMELDGEFNLTGIGRLFYNIEGKMQFEPCDAGILTPSFYGLGGFEFRYLSDAEIKPVDTLVKEPVAKPKKEEPIVPKPEPTSVDDTEPIAIEEEEETDEQPKALCIPLNALRYAVAAACMVIAIMLFPPQKNEPMTEQCSVYQQELKIETMPKMEPVKKVTKPVVKPEATPAKEADLKKETISKEKEQSKQDIAIKETKKPDVAPAKKEEINKPYHTIILASKVSKKNAEAFVERLAKEGIKAEVLTRNSITRVTSGKYTSETEAHNSLRQIQSKTNDAEEAWVMEIKNQ